MGVHPFDHLPLCHPYTRIQPERNIAPFIVNQPDQGMLLRVTLDDPAGAVSAHPVDDEDLQPVRRVILAEHVLHDRSNVSLFIIAGNKDRYKWKHVGLFYRGPVAAEYLFMFQKRSKFLRNIRPGRKHKPSQLTYLYPISFR